MQDILPDLKKWVNSDQPTAIATVISTWGSSPREVGAKMAVNAKGEMTGSVSGGCVEGAVVEAALETIQTGKPQYLHFGVADETAWEVGLACGGMIDVFVQVLDPVLFATQAEAIQGNEGYAALTCVKGPEAYLGHQIVHREEAPFQGDGKGIFPREVIDQAVQAYEHGGTKIIPGETQSTGESSYFLDVHHPPPTLIIVGGVHISIALVKIANTLGYRTVVVDPRRAFGSETRFEDANQLIQQWPDKALQAIGINRSTAIAVLTHDPKLDDPGLMVALPSKAFYVGALGSKGTQAKRRKRLLEAGLSESQLDRLHGPIGLDLGGRSPEEIALSIMGEIVQVRNRSA